MAIEKATISNSEVLTQISLVSKAYWGYSKEHKNKNGSVNY
jgi:hypothetical protein